MNIERIYIFEFRKFELTFYSLEAALEKVRREKIDLEEAVAQLERELAAKEREKAAVAGDLLHKLQLKEADLTAIEARQRAELERVHVEHRLQVERLENDAQQMAAETDAEGEQLKFDFNRKIDELSASHAAALERLGSNHAEQLQQIESSHQHDVERLNRINDQLLADQADLSKGDDFIRFFTLMTPVFNPTKNIFSQP